MFPPAEIDPLAAFAGVGDVPNAGGGTPPAPAPVGIPNIVGGAPGGAPDYGSILSQLNPPQQTGWRRNLAVALPLIAAGAALANKNRGVALGSFADKYQQGIQANEQATARDALMKERLAKAIKDLQAETTAQKKIDAIAAGQEAARAAAKQKEHLNTLRQTYDRLTNTPGTDNLIERVNEMVDKGENVDAYLSSIIDLGDGTKVPLSDVMKFAVKAPDGKHFVGGKAKEPKEIIAGSAQDWVEMALGKAVEQNGGKPITLDRKQAVTKLALDQYKNLGPAGDMIELNKSIKNLELSILQAKKDEIFRNMAPQARLLKVMPAADRTRIADMDNALQENDRLGTLLKVTGLENDNNPIMPKLAGVLVSMGINPGEIPADVFQGAAFTRAKLFMVLGRGNAGRSMLMMKELQKHLNDPIASGKQLAETVKDLKREYMNTRHNSLRVAGAEAGIPDDQVDAVYPYISTLENGEFYFGQRVKTPDGKWGTVSGFKPNGEVVVTVQ